ncbi:MAG: PKD domain-containing protein [Bacteroidia bacterium]|nr:PKD domain-containing protein [Bacteroidia bacterium]MCF8445428.1 PKD domain-containing protein [Bacteroidia bacterium]
MKKLILALSLILLFGSNSNASHVVGASDLSYQCTATPGVFNVTLKLYRDCNEIQMCYHCPTFLSASCSQLISINGAASPAGSGMPNSPCTGVSFGTQTLNIVTAVSGFDVVQLCATEKTLCSNCGSRIPGTFTPGIEVYTFEGQVNLNTLPTSCCFVSLGFNICCRNSGITTITNPSTLNFYTEAIINRCATPCNSSPSFINDPVIVACSGVDFTYNLGAVDPDDDSLSYAFGQLLGGPGASAPYVSPYSPTVPLPYWGAPVQSPPAVLPLGIYINAMSGDIQFRPMGIFIANFIIEVKQWKTIGGIPTLMGITRRDIQFYSQFCVVNDPPKLRTYDQNGVLTSTIPKYEFTIPAGIPFCTIISAWDGISTTDTTDITWNNPSNLIDTGNTGATLTKLYNTNNRGINGPKKDSVRFCWTPPSNSSRNLPYYFVITAKDRACPIKASTMHSFAINVYGCKASINFNNSSQCLRENYFSFSSSNSLKSGPISCHWDFGDSTQSNLITGSHTYSRAGKFPVTLIITDSIGCKDTLIKEATVIPSPEIISIIGQDSNLAPGLSYIYRANTSDSIIYKWSVTNGILLSNSNIDSAIVAWNNNSVGSIRLDIENNLGCKDSLILITHPDSINSVCKADFTTNSLGQCLNQNNFQFTNASTISGLNIYNLWDFGDGILDSTSNTSHSYSAPGTYLVKLRISTNFGCLDSISKTIQVFPQPGPITIYGQDSNLIVNYGYIYRANSLGASSFDWSITNGILLTNSSIDSVLVNWSSLGLGKLKVRLETNFGCKDSMEILTQIDSIIPTCNADFTANSFGQCLNQNSFQFTNNSSIFGSNFYSIWDFGDGILDTTLNPNHSYLTYGTYLVKLRIESNLGCIDSTIKTISVYPQAGPVSIIGSDSNLINGTNYLYSAIPKGLFRYQWSATNGIIMGTSNLDSTYINWNASSTGNLKVIVSTIHNCSDSAELTVSILTSGIKETSNFGKISLYPNPNKGKFYLSLELPKTKEITLKIYNILGIEVMSLTKTIGSGKQEIELPTSLKAGVYFLNLSDGIEESQIKFIIEE